MEESVIDEVQGIFGAADDRFKSISERYESHKTAILL